MLLEIRITARQQTIIRTHARAHANCTHAMCCARTRRDNLPRNPPPPTPPLPVFPTDIFYMTFEADERKDHVSDLRSRDSQHVAFWGTWFGMPATFYFACYVIDTSATLNSRVSILCLPTAIQPRCDGRREEVCSPAWNPSWID